MLMENLTGLWNEVKHEPGMMRHSTSNTIKVVFFYTLKKTRTACRPQPGTGVLVDIDNVK
ncbi:hypothetical protein J2T09_004071 [Neorhizobium huautlense]|uniref:Transposase n=1 Tax=Neorhizobium huautlense TaxID=67774 RepID=A0ABT9PXU0_9HYPH|nr:hypothetical protein [Neorhizobium huautlense]MDP9839295.1 hypothetical protein [Neorhizobium huautlense]